MLTVKPNEVTKEKLETLLIHNPVDTFTIKCIKNYTIVFNGEQCYIPALLEKTIESSGMSCRIYQKGRFLSVLVPWVGVPALIGMVAHNIATFNPDFEIRKELGGDVLVTNLKKIELDKKKVELDKMAKKQSGK